MTEYLAKQLVDQLFQSGFIEEADREIYQYSALVLIEKVIGISIMFVFASVWDVLGETILFILFFDSLRKYTGGYHAGTFLQCLIGTEFIYIIFVTLIYPILLHHINCSWIILFVAGIIVFVIGAINHPCMDWSKEEYQNSKKMARITVILEIGLIAVAIYFAVEAKYILFMSFGVILCAFLLILGKVFRQEVKYDE